MANISFGVIVADARGKIGGAVFTKARNGATVRRRVRPSNPRTSAQTGIRTDMTNVSRLFKGFTPTELSDWQAYAASITLHNHVTGAAYHPSAINAFAKLGTKFLQVAPGGTVPTTPPATPFAGDSASVTAAGAAGKITFTISANNAAGVVTELLVQRLASPNRKPAPNGYRTAFYWTGVLATPHDVTGLAPGTYAVAYKFVKSATGEQTNIVTLPIVTVT